MHAGKIPIRCKIELKEKDTAGNLCLIVTWPLRLCLPVFRLPWPHKDTSLLDLGHALVYHDLISTEVSGPAKALFLSEVAFPGSVLSMKVFSSPCPVYWSWRPSCPILASLCPFKTMACPLLPIAAQGDMFFGAWGTDWPSLGPNQILPCPSNRSIKGAVKSCLGHWIHAGSFSLPQP